MQQKFCLRLRETVAASPAPLHWLQVMPDKADDWNLLIDELHACLALLAPMLSNYVLAARYGIESVSHIAVTAGEDRLNASYSQPRSL
jgi:hypothetical protein